VGVAAAATAVAASSTAADGSTLCPGNEPQASAARVNSPTKSQMLNRLFIMFFGYGRCR
jgi:hypothetical protein